MKLSVSRVRINKGLFNKQTQESPLGRVPYAATVKYAKTMKKRALFSAALCAVGITNAAAEDQVGTGVNRLVFSVMHARVSAY